MKEVFDRARTFSCLDVKKEPKCFQIMHSVLTDTKTVIDSLSSSTLDLSFQEENLSAESSDEKNDEKMSDEENESVLNESELQEKSLLPAAFETNKS